MDLRKLSLPWFLLAALLPLRADADESARVIPPPSVDEAKAPAAATEIAVLSGGCFWGMQGIFEHLKGVREVVAGYAGGAAKTAQYETVSGGGTGHAESVRIAFDPSVISYGAILRIYFSVAHDPTQLDRQGPDFGPQYRSNIFFTNGSQERIARAYVAQLARSFASPIVTRIDRFAGFYPAEGYHQDYLIHNPDSPYIIINDLPKIDNLKKLYPAFYRDDPVRLGMVR